MGYHCMSDKTHWAFATCRAVAVAASASWMCAFPACIYFPPAGAFCALYVDQTIANATFSTLQYKYALFPCASGIIFLLLCTRALASVLSIPLQTVNGFR